MHNAIICTTIKKRVAFYHIISVPEFLITQLREKDEDIFAETDD